VNSTVQTQDETQILQLMAEHEAAMRAKDAEWLVARFAPGAETFDLAPPLRNTGREVLDASAKKAWFAGFDGPIDFEIRDLTVVAGEDVAFCHSLNRLSATPHGSPAKFDLWFRATVGLRKAGGEWKVVHEHNSTPFHMDGSFRAALELTP
jgi:ketosteroid isomerase-like protein